MKKALLTLTTIFVAAQLLAQNFEVSVQANSGLFRYGGSSATSNSFITEGPNQVNYTNNPFGSKNGFSYGWDLQVQHAGKCGFIFGLQAGYDILRSKVNINEYHDSNFILFPGPNSPGGYVEVPVKGQTYLQDQDININPYIGYRLQTKKVKIDLLPGIDLGINIGSYDKGYTIDGDRNIYRTNLKLTNAPTDVRPGFGIAAWYGRFGITAAYSVGLTNLDKSTAGNGSAHSELLRFGITCRIF